MKNYDQALVAATHEEWTVYHSRIDGALLSFRSYEIEVAPAYLSSITVRRCS